MLEWPFADNALERIGGTMFVVYDQKTLDLMQKEEGIDLGVGVMVPVGTKLTKFDEEWDAAVKAGWAFKADTFERLAKATGVDPAKLIKTVEAYNGFCAVRRGAEFAKDPAYLRRSQDRPVLGNQERSERFGHSRRHQGQ